MTIGLVVIKNNQAVIAADTRCVSGRIICENHEKIQKLSENVYACLSGYDILSHALNDYNNENDFSTFVGKSEYLLRKYFYGFKEFVINNKIINYSPEDGETYSSCGFSGLLISPFGCYLVFSDFVIQKFNKFKAIGSGTEFATGAISILYNQELSAKEIAKRTVVIPADFLTNCNKEYTIYSVTMENNNDNNN